MSSILLFCFRGGFWLFRVFCGSTDFFLVFLFLYFSELKGHLKSVRMIS